MDYRQAVRAVGGGLDSYADRVPGYAERITTMGT